MHVFFICKVKCKVGFEFFCFKGPISVAVYTDVDHVERTLWDMAKLLHCNKAKNIKLQLVLPAQSMSNSIF